MLPAYPHRPLQLLSGQQIPSYYFREQSMAWHIHDQQKQHPDQKNFISFVGRDHLLNVAKHLTIFINDENQFNSYK
jgi:hypothetical protein